MHVPQHLALPPPLTHLFLSVSAFLFLSLCLSPPFNLASVMWPSQRWVGPCAHKSPLPPFCLSRREKCQPSRRRQNYTENVFCPRGSSAAPCPDLLFFPPKQANLSPLHLAGGGQIIKKGGRKRCSSKKLNLGPDSVCHFPVAIPLHQL